MKNLKILVCRNRNRDNKVFIGITFLIFGLLFSLNVINAQDIKGKTEEKKSIAEVLMDIAYEGNLEKIKTMIEKQGVDVDLTLKNEETALTCASYQGNFEMVQYLISKGADVHKRNQWNNTSYSNAAMQGHNEIVKLLLKSGVDVNEKGNSGYTGLHHAIYGNQEETVKLLLVNGADVNILDDNGTPPIEIASWYGNAKIISELISHGADINFKTAENNSVMHNLAGNGYTESIRLALKNGVNVNVVDEDGRLPLHYAIIYGYPEVAELLIPKTSNVNLKEKTLGNTPLHIAALNGDVKSSKALIKAKAKTNIENNSGKMPIDYITKYGYSDLVSLYADAGFATKEQVELTERSIKTANKQLTNGQTGIVHTGHSGWIVQTQNNFLVFDYWDQAVNADKCLANGSLSANDMKGKNVYIFVSHDHSDHFDTTIYTWANQVENITYIFGFKPEESSLYESRTYNGPLYKYVDNNKSEKINNIKVTTLKSNDTGQGFLVEMDGLTIYHPGDHALFTAEDEAGFKKEVDFIADNTSKVDIAFLPVTGCPSRWEKEFIVQGFFYSIDKLNPQQVFPMHASQQEYTLKEFAEMAEKRKCPSKILCVENKGDNFIYTNELTVKK